MPLFLHTTPRRCSERGGNFILKNPTTFFILETYLTAEITRKESDQSTMTSAFQYGWQCTWKASQQTFVACIDYQRYFKGAADKTRPKRRNAFVQTDCSDSVCLQTQPLLGPNVINPKFRHATSYEFSVYSTDFGEEYDLWPCPVLVQIC